MIRPANGTDSEMGRPNWALVERNGVGKNNLVFSSTRYKLNVIFIFFGIQVVVLVVLLDASIFMSCNGSKLLVIIRMRS